MLKFIFHTSLFVKNRYTAYISKTLYVIVKMLYVFLCNKIFHCTNNFRNYHNFRLRGDYDGERFTYAQSLVFVQCLVNGLFAHFGECCFGHYFSTMISCVIIEWYFVNCCLAMS